MSREESKSSRQGRPLPPDGSPVGAFPVGSCVRMSVPGVFAGETSWYMITNVIHGNRNPHVRRLVHPPTSPDWNCGPSRTWEVSERLVVHGSAWPLRVADARSVPGVDVDPVMANLRLEVVGGGVDLVSSTAKS